MLHSIAPTQKLLLQLHATGSLPPLAVIALKFAVLVTKWHQKQRTRHQLATLTDEQLQDIGLTRHDAICEANKNFWE